MRGGLKNTAVLQRKRIRLALPPPVMTEEELNELFDKSNKVYFNGKLPKYNVTWNEPGNGQMASCHPWFPSIYISPIWTVGKSKIKIRKILLHEMCHIGQGKKSGHGYYWKRKMMRLYGQGERWVLRDLAIAKRADGLQETMFKMILEMSDYDPRWHWNSVRSMLKKKFGRDATEILLLHGANLLHVWRGHQQSSDLSRNDI